MTIRIDAPGPCGCNIQWTDSPTGPKAKPCECAGKVDAAPPGGTLDAAARKAAGDDYFDTRGPSRLDAALERKAKAEDAAERDGRSVPAGAMIKRV